MTRRTGTIIALAAGALLLTGCGSETYSVTDRVTDDAWNRKTITEQRQICAGVELFGTEFIAREIEDGARANGASIPDGTDFTAMAERIKRKCEAR